MLKEEVIKNKKATVCYTAINMVLLAAYILEYLKGSRTMLYLLMFTLLDLIPLILTWVVLKRKEDHVSIRWIILLGFGLLYALALFTAKNYLTFVYCIPMMLLLMIYASTRLSVIACVPLTVINIIYIVMRVIQGQTGQEAVAAYEIQVALLVMVAVFSYFVTRITEDINLEKMKDIELNAKKQEATLQQVLTATRSISEAMTFVNTQSGKISSQSTNTKNAVEEIVNGSNELADNIQTQLQMTENIQTLISNMDRNVTSNKETFMETSADVQEGNRNIAELQKAALSSQEACQTVSETMQTLIAKIKETRSALEIINNVASETSLLSLNASIEAAHAGDAGRGFAVVASEIQTLADSTKVATADIEKIFIELETQSNLAQQSIGSLVEASEKQDKILGMTAEKFEHIGKSISTMSQNIEEQQTSMHSISSSNGEISNKVSDLSAFSEELLANTENTKSLADQTIDGICSVSGSVEEVMKDIEQLKNLA